MDTSVTVSASPMETAARAYRDAGVSILPIADDGSKQPAFVDAGVRLKWKPLQSRLPTEREVAAWWRNTGNGIAVICGRISGGLVLIDVDDPGTAEEFLASFAAILPDLYARVPIITSPRPGKHLYVRIEEPEGNEVLARNAAKATLIETRGEGGYALAPPSPSACHPTGRLYQPDLRGLSIEDAPLLNAEEKELLWDLCRAFDRAPARIVDMPPRNSGPVNIALERDRPGDAYNRDAQWPEILQAAGWTFLFTSAAGITHWCRPGKRSGTSGTTGATGDYFYCFTSNAAPFEPGKAYSKFAALVYTQFNGNWTEAAKAVHHNSGFVMPKIAPPSMNGEAKVVSTSIPEPVFELTELGNAYRLDKLCGEETRWVDERREWAIYRNGRWHWDKRKAVLRAAQQLPKLIREQALKTPDQEYAEKVFKWAQTSQGYRNVTHTLGHLQGVKGIAAVMEDFDRHPDLYNTPNGTIDLSTGEFRKADRRDMLMTSSTALYDPDATCPEWLRFLESFMCGDMELVAYLQVLAGYCLTGHVREHCLHVFYGTGNNGKSTYLDTQYSIMGHDYAFQTTPDLLIAKKHETHPTDMAALRGKRLAITSELDGESKLNNVRLKQLTGGDLITARYLYADNFTFKPTHKLIMATNHPPRISEHTAAMRRRLKVVPCNLRLEPEEVDKRLPDRLMAEASGIQNWMIEGARLWYANGLEHPQVIQKVSAEHFAGTDMLDEWIGQFCRVDPEAWSPHADLYQSYCRWAESAGVKAVASQTFGDKLSERIEFTRRTQQNKRGWKGLELNRPALRVEHPNNA